MITLHYSPGNIYAPSSDATSCYADYTTLSNVPADRLDQSASPNGPSVNESAPSSMMSTLTCGPYYTDMDGYGESSATSSAFHPVERGQFVLKSSPSPSAYHHHEYHSNSHPDLYSSHVGDDLPPALVPHQQLIQLNMTIGPGAVQQQSFPVVCNPMQISKNCYGSYLSIIEQPTNRIRYRYRSEKGSHGGLNGVNSTQVKKTYPTVKVENYNHQAKVYVRASLATNEELPKPHVHKLMGRHCSEDGACTLPLADNMTAMYAIIGKKEVPDILYRRKLLEYQSRYFSEPLTEKLKEKLREQSEKEAKDMNLNSVKICFEAFMLQNEMLYPICPPIYSRPIANQKSPDSGELKIVRINRYSGSVGGGDEVYLLCEKVNKKEIRVRFFELDTNGNQQWEAFGSFSESDVHHQVAIVFRTPPYRDPNICKPAQVYLQLFRQRDGEFSEPRTFIYRPKSMNDSYNDFNADSLTSKCGIQEGVLTRIKMENQPPGYKRRKYSHGHHPFQPQQQSLKLSTMDAVQSKNNPTSNGYSKAKQVGSSRGSNSKGASSQNKNQSRSVVIKTEVENEIDQISADHYNQSVMSGSGDDASYRQESKPANHTSNMTYLEKAKQGSDHSSPRASSVSSSPPLSASSTTGHSVYDHVDSMWTSPNESSMMLASEFYSHHTALHPATTFLQRSPSGLGSAPLLNVPGSPLTSGGGHPPSQLSPMLTTAPLISASPHSPNPLGTTSSYSNSGPICMLYS